MDVSLVSFVCCQVDVSATGRGVLPTAVCHCVSSRNLNEEAALARVGLLRQRKDEEK